MKKLIAGLLAAAVVSFAAFADEEGGLKVSGFLRGGISDATTKGAVYHAATWMQGGYFGGGSRLRLNIDYTKNNGGVTFRYQSTASYEYNDEKSVLTNEWKFIDEANVKWAMAYANFADGQIVAEAGKLRDRYTRTGGWEDSNIDGGKGLRLVFAPQFVPGLILAAQASDFKADKYEQSDSKVKDGKAHKDDIKFDKKVLGFSGKYGNEAFYVVGGASLANYFYGAAGLTAVENLSLVAEVYHDATDTTKAKHGDKAATELVFWAEYTGVEKLLVGAYSYVDLCDGDYVAKITPAVSYDVTDWVKLSAESTIYLDSDDKTDTYATISPAVTFKASPKATATVSGLISTDDKQTPHAFTAGVRYNF